MANQIFDFGFTAVDEDELEAVQTVTIKQKDTEKTAKELQSKIDDLYNASLMNDVSKIRNILKTNVEGFKEAKNE